MDVGISQRAKGGWVRRSGDRSFPVQVWDDRPTDQVSQKLKKNSELLCRFQRSLWRILTDSWFFMSLRNWAWKKLEGASPSIKPPLAAAASLVSLKGWHWRWNISSVLIMPIHQNQVQSQTRCRVNTPNMTAYMHQERQDALLASYKSLLKRRWDNCI